MTFDDATNTPRTDEQVEGMNHRTVDLIGCGPDGGLGPCEVVTALFARELERELDQCEKLLLKTQGELIERNSELGRYMMALNAARSAITPAVKP